MLGYPPKGPLQRVNEGQCDRLAGLRRVVGDGLIDVPLRRLPRNHRLGSHASGRWRTHWRSVSK